MLFGPNDNVGRIPKIHFEVKGGRSSFKSFEITIKC